MVALLIPSLVPSVMPESHQQHPQFHYCSYAHKQSALLVDLLMTVMRSAVLLALAVFELKQSENAEQKKKIKNKKEYLWNFSPIVPSMVMTES